MFKNVFSYNGRIRRLEFGISLIIQYILYYGLLTFFDLKLDWILTADDETKALMFFVLFFLNVIYVLQGIKRCHDIGKSGWWFLVPFFNPLWLIFQEGSIEDNEYGSSPKLDSIILNETNNLTNENKNYQMSNTNEIQRKQLHANIDFPQNMADDILYNNVVDLINNSDYKKAKALLTNAINTFPDNTDYKKLMLILDQVMIDTSSLGILYSEAENLFNEKDYLNALSKVNQLIEIDPHPNNFELKKTIEQAIQDLKLENLKLNEAVYFYENNNLKEAYKSINEYQKLNPLKFDKELYDKINDDFLNIIFKDINSFIDKNELKLAIDEVNNILKIEISKNNKNQDLIDKLKNKKDIIEENAYKNALNYRKIDELLRSMESINIALECTPNSKKYTLFKNEIQDEINRIENRSQNKKILGFLLIFLTVIIALWYFITYKKESDLWKKSNTENSINSYEQYIKEYPDGNYKKEATIKLDSLIKLDSIEWTTAIKLNTIESYSYYFDSQIYGKFRTNAEEKLDTLYWEKCIKDKTIEAYNLYLNKMKNGIHYNEVLALYNSIKMQDIEVESSIKDNVRSQIESYYYNLSSNSYDDLITIYTPIVSKYLTIKNVSKVKIIEMHRDYVAKNQIYSQKCVIDPSSLIVKYIDNENYRSTFNMDYFIYKTDEYTGNSVKQYYNLDIEILLNNSFKIYSVSQKIISKDLNYMEEYPTTK